MRRVRQCLIAINLSNLTLQRLTTQLQFRAHKSLVMSDAGTGAEGDARITLGMGGRVGWGTPRRADPAPHVAAAAAQLVGPFSDPASWRFAVQRGGRHG